MTEVPVADCLRLTKALQKTAEGLQSVADLYDDNVSCFQKRTSYRINRSSTGTKDAIKLTRGMEGCRTPVRIVCCA
jgi:hypothetical protein